MSVPPCETHPEADVSPLFASDRTPAQAGALRNTLLWQGVLMAGLLALSRYDYLLFHSLAELYSIVIAGGIFIVAWSARRHYHHDYLLFIGIAYLFVAGFDTLHMLGYHGMPVFTGFPGYDLGPQLWLVARSMEACTLVVAPWFIRRPLRPARAVMIYAAISSLALWAIFLARIFPVCFVPDQGLTSFKIVSEYVIVVLFLAALILLRQQRRGFDRQVYRLLLGSVMLTVASELCFTLYISHYGASNLLGHLFKILSFTLIYFAIIDTALNRPFSILFRDLKQRQDALLAAQRAAKQGSWSWQFGEMLMTWSEGVHRQLGSSAAAESATLETMVAAVHPGDRETLRRAFEQAMLEQRSFEVEVRHPAPQGECRWLHFEGACERDERNHPVLAGIVQDVTERVAAERLRDDIDSITRHDLRVPLTPIIGLPELLLKNDSLTPKQREMLQDIHACGLKMLGMINSSLTLYKIERGNYQVQSDYFDLAGELRELLREVADKAGERQVACLVLHDGVPFGVDEHFGIFGERLLCYTLFANLLTNALEASPQGGIVTIDLHQADAFWQVAIHNDGVVPAEILPRFFEKYATHGKVQGTGLGTYSALMVARAHGGTIRLATGAAAGTTLTVELPKPVWLRAGQHD